MRAVNARIIIRVNAGIALALGLALLAPMLLSLGYGDGSWASFSLPAAALSMVGALGLMSTRPASSGQAVRYVSNRDVLFSVTLAWVLAALLGGVPYLIEGTFSNGQHHPPGTGRPWFVCCPRLPSLRGAVPPQAERNYTS